ncbi:MAG: ATP-binding protein [Candidatus Omnitrophota bacterium]
MKKAENLIRKFMGQAIGDYNMIEPQDRILVGVSGGKDSLCLLNMLRQRQRFSPVKYEIFPVHFNENDENTKVIEQYFKDYGFEYVILPKKWVKKTKRGKKPCFNCSWERRTNLFKIARKLNCRKIALAHHKDDMIQTTLLNMFYAGDISTMVPSQEFFQGNIYIIRPLAYVEERFLEQYAKENNLPNLPFKCPHGEKSSRRLMKELIDQVAKDCPDVRTNIFRSCRL